MKKLIYYFMQFKREDETTEFYSLKHNTDLCPRIKVKIDDIVSKYNKYRTITYDIQGFKDEGTDVVVRLSYKNNTKYICFQIKSNDDLKDANYLPKIKAQALDTQNSYGSNLLDYYILVCCDLTSNNVKKSNMNKLRQIEAAFNKVENIHVIEPSYVMGFLKISSLQMDVAIKNKMSNEDIIIKNAIDIVIDLTPTERALLYYLSYQYIFKGNEIIMIEDIYYNNFICETYIKVKDYSRQWFFIDDNKYNKSSYKDKKRKTKQRIIEDLDFLSNDYIDLLENNSVVLNINLVLPIISLILDGSIRYDYDESETLNYLMILLGGMKGYDI
ncbi:hypothetical protein JYG23_08145 [Sedimentibacter sp. zth1]|uniref:hypothetical protein n=1 Tax=Sedimentibacter sp. zth1 TaxID=2816908 RepID=UPI001A90FC8E|nr:hypothetical protein [Sedimentibacter sp. zth1]QSX04679.1 hypothetical protein JYG23_08145 [Sedimentibacter sp. zth1]